MIPHPIECECLFQYFFIVDISSSIRTVKTRYPEDATFSEEISNQIIHLTQSLNPFDLPDEVNKLSKLTYIDLIDLPNKNNNETETYFAYLFNSSSKAPVKILISKYYHPKLLEGILENDVCNNDSSLFHKISKISFIMKDKYTVSIDLPDEDIPEKYSHFLKYDLSQVSEINYSRRIFLAHFPPYYMYQIIYYLFSSYKIIVCSSSIPRISSIVFAINSFLYPLQKNTFLVKTIPILNRNDKEKIQIDGPCIIGVHDSILNEVLPLLSPESKYIVFNTDIPYITSQPKTIIKELELECQTGDNSQEQLTRNALQKERSITSLFHNAHKDTITYVYQFEHVFPAFHIQSRISDFIISLIKCFYEIPPEKYLKEDIISGLDNAVKDPRYAKLFKEGSLSKALLDQLKNPSKYEDTVKLYFPKESGTPMITVPQLRNDFIELYNFRPSSPTLRAPTIKK